MLHEALVMLFRNRPTLAAEVAVQALGLHLPRFDEARIEPSELGQVAPTEYRADLVVVLRSGGGPVFCIIVEAQLSKNADKRFAWPAYQSNARATHRCPAMVLVICASARVAAWCARPIVLGPGRSVMTPIVLGPRAVPVVAAVEDAKSAPELSVLSAMAHGRGEPEVASAVAFAALVAVRDLDEQRARIYADLVASRLGEAARIALEELMQGGKYEYQSDFAKRYYGQGRAEGEARGRAEGEATGRAEGGAAALLTVLAARGLAVPDEARARIAACRDLAALERWLVRAANANSVDEVLAD